jgi:hypothetical protein
VAPDVQVVFEWGEVSIHLIVDGGGVGEARRFTGCS